MYGSCNNESSRSTASTVDSDAEKEEKPITSHKPSFLVGLSLLLNSCSLNSPPRCKLETRDPSSMAVQAQQQHPSSHDLLLIRNLQEGHELDSSLQPPQFGGPEFLNRSHMLFSNGASSSKQKRRREISSFTNIASSVNNPISFQKNPQLIDLSQLRNHRGTSTGLRLSFYDQQQQKSLFRSSLLSSDEIAAQIKRQREEIDQLVGTQGEQLRETLLELKRRQYRAVIGAAEATVGRRLGEKEAEAERAARRNAELEARAAELTVEAQIWQARARAHESTTAALQAQLQQAIVSVGGEERMAAEEVNQAEDADSAYIDPDRAVLAGSSCKACWRGVATVVLLPCRHLSVCMGCDGEIVACPVCFCLKRSSVEVYL